MNTDKLKAYRDSLTPEQKAAGIVKMQAARVAKALQREANKNIIKTEYMDASYWGELASKFCIRMPSNLEPIKASVIIKYLKRAGVSIETWNEHYTNTAYFCKHNSLWSCYAVAGLILELREQRNKPA